MNASPASSPGTKHKTMLEARSGTGSIKSFPRAGIKTKLTVPGTASTGLQNKTFHCETCDVHVNSETQLKQVSGETRDAMIRVRRDGDVSKYSQQLSPSVPIQFPSDHSLSVRFEKSSPTSVKTTCIVNLDNVISLSHI